MPRSTRALRGKKRPAPAPAPGESQSSAAGQPGQIPQPSKAALKRARQKANKQARAASVPPAHGGGGQQGRQRNSLNPGGAAKGRGKNDVKPGNRAANPKGSDKGAGKGQLPAGASATMPDGRQIRFAYNRGTCQSGDS